MADRTSQWIYTENLSSRKTGALFLALMLLFANEQNGGLKTPAALHSQYGKSLI
jgi:hypothetical protein